MIKNFFLVFFDRLRGIKYAKKEEIKIDLNKTTSKKKILSVVSQMNNRYNLHFYDAFYDLPSTEKPWPLGDTGAFAEVKKDKGVYRAKLGNHGGYKNNGQWIKMSENELVDCIYKSREYNGGNMSIASRLVRKLWIKKENGKSLFFFYHDISDIKETF